MPPVIGNDGRVIHHYLAARAELDAPGSPLATSITEVRGIPVKVYTTAPPNMRVMWEATAVHADKDYIVYEDERYSYAEIHAQVRKLAQYLVSQGIGRHSRVALSMRNYPEWVVGYWATVSIGAAAVGMNAWWTPSEMEYALNDSQPGVLIVDDERLERLSQIANTPKMHVISVRTDRALPAGGARWNDVMAAADPGVLPNIEFDQDDDATIFYTSGTTGRPKGVRGALSGGMAMTPDIMKFIAAGFSNFLPIPGRTMLCGPFYHSAQWAFSFFPMIGGSTTVMQHKYDSAAMLQMIDRYSCTNVHLVPTQMKRLLDLPAEVKNEFSGASLTTVWHGAAPCPPAVKRGLIDWWGPKITEYYGSTEGSIISTVSSTEWLAKGGSVGKPLDSVEVIVVNDESERVAQGQEGTLYFKNKMGTDFSYHNDEAKTRDSHLEPGVFTTGDVGYIDSDGYLWLSDRKIDMIISGGVNIYPAQIEAVLQPMPGVADCAVFGVPDPVFGEKACAFVVAKPGERLGFDELIAFLKAQRIASFKLPERLEIVSEFPVSTFGKVSKKVLAETVAKKLQAEHGA